MRRIFFAILIIALQSHELLGQSLDSLALKTSSGATYIHESDIVDWNWMFQSIRLKPSSIQHLSNHPVDSNNWGLWLGEKLLLEGYFLPSTGLDVHDSVYISILPEKRTVRVSRFETIGLIYLTASQHGRRGADWRIDPLFNPLLLAHLLSRNLIPADYRMRFLLGRIGLGLVAKGIERP